VWFFKSACLLIINSSGPASKQIKHEVHIKQAEIDIEQVPVLKEKPIISAPSSKVPLAQIQESSTATFVAIRARIRDFKPSSSIP
jgi:hypothetical protein